MRAEKIMVVEDETIIAKDIEGILTREGYTVPAITINGHKALEMASVHKPDLVLMDICLEGSMDGIEVSERLNSNLKIPSIYLTSYLDPQTLNKAKKTNPYGYILKPFKSAELLTSIEVALNRIEHDKGHMLVEYPQYLLEELHNGYVLWNISQNIVSFSRRWLSNYGIEEYDSEPTINLWFDRVHPEDRERLFSDLKIEDGNESIESEYRLKLKDGSWCWMNFKGLAYTNDEGKLMGLAGIQSDINDRHIAEDALIHYVYNDHITELPSRVSFLYRLYHLFSQSLGEDKDYGFTVFFVNVTQPRNGERRYNYLKKDAIFRQLTNNLMNCLEKERKSLYLWDRNVFAILIERPLAQAYILEKSRIFTERLNYPGIYFPEDIDMEIDVGVVKGPQNFSTPEALLESF